MSQYFHYLSTYTTQTMALLFCLRIEDIIFKYCEVKLKFSLVRMIKSEPKLHSSMIITKTMISCWFVLISKGYQDQSNVSNSLYFYSWHSLKVAKTMNIFPFDIKHFISS